MKFLYAIELTAFLLGVPACTYKEIKLEQAPNYYFCRNNYEFEFKMGSSSFSEVKESLEQKGVSNLVGEISLAVVGDGVYGALMGDCSSLYLFENGKLSGEVKISDIGVIGAKLHGAQFFGGNLDQAILLLASDTLSLNGQRVLVSVGYQSQEVRYHSVEELAREYDGFQNPIFIGNNVVEPNFIMFNARNNDGNPWRTAPFKLYFSNFKQLELKEMDYFCDCDLYHQWLYQGEE